MSDDNEHLDEPVSKSQKKRDMQAFREMATRLVSLPAEHTEKFDPDITEAVSMARNITKGNARKRQIAYIAKLLSKADTTEIRETLDLLDASSAAHISHFHQLETWRERLIDGDTTALDEIFDTFPSTDRQQLRTLIRQAATEKAKGEQGRHFRKLFQFLKSLDNDAESD